MRISCWSSAVCSSDLFLGRAKEVRRQQPLVQRDLGTLIERADRHRELLAALRTEPEAGPCALALQLVGAVDASAVRADRAIGPAHALQILPGGGFVRVAGFGDVRQDRKSTRLNSSH